MLDTIKVNGFNDFGQDVFEFYYNIQKLSDALTELRILSNGSKVY